MITFNFLLAGTMMLLLAGVMFGIIRQERRVHGCSPVWYAVPAINAGAAIMTYLMALPL